MTEGVPSAPVARQREGYKSFGLILGVGAGLPLAGWTVAIPDAVEPFSAGFPAAQRFYLASKFLGLSAFCLLWLQTLYGLCRPVIAVQRILRFDRAAHRQIGLSAFLVLTLHAGCYFLAVSLKNGAMVFQVFLPDFATGYFQTSVSIGVLAFYGVVIAVISGLLRAAGAKRGRWLHLAGPPAFFASWLHSAMIGSEVMTTPLAIVHMLALLSVAVAVLAHIGAKVGNPSCRGPSKSSRF